MLDARREPFAGSQATGERRARQKMEMEDEASNAREEGRSVADRCN